MKQLLLLGLIGLLCCAPVSAQVVTNGLSIALARKAMESAGYKQTALDMYYNKPNSSMESWAIGEGVLNIGYSTVSEAITALGFFLCDERAKGSRKTFNFEVASFDTATGLMVIKTRPGEPVSAANRSQPIRPKTNGPSAPTGSGR